eukprot:956934_1
MSNKSLPNTSSKPVSGKSSKSAPTSSTNSASTTPSKPASAASSKQLPTTSSKSASTKPSKPVSNQPNRIPHRPGGPIMSNHYSVQNGGKNHPR